MTEQYIGILSVVYSRLVGDNGKVYSFEPVNETFSRLKENLALNGCDNVMPIKIALSDNSGSSDMQIFGESLSGLNSLAKPKYPTYNSNNVAVKTKKGGYDNFYSSQQNLSLIQ